VALLSSRDTAHGEESGTKWYLEHHSYLHTKEFRNVFESPDPTVKSRHKSHSSWTFVLATVLVTPSPGPSRTQHAYFRDITIPCWSLMC
jgi:hypothetical protein